MLFCCSSLQKVEYVSSSLGSWMVFNLLTDREVIFYDFQHLGLKKTFIFYSHTLVTLVCKKHGLLYDDRSPRDLLNPPKSSSPGPQIWD